MATINGTKNNDTLEGTEDSELINGLQGNDSISAADGNDTLDAGTGIDTLHGGDGDDTFIVDGLDDVISDTSGIDTVVAKITKGTYTLGAELEILALFGTANIQGVGNVLDNTLTGNDGANTLDGGLGADTMDGGKGNDTYLVDNILDVVSEDLTVAEKGGIDHVNASVSYALGANIENLTLTGDQSINGTGNELNNTITGNDQSNVLTGAGGVDKLAGGKGDDTYEVNLVQSGKGSSAKAKIEDSVVESKSSGNDTIKLTLPASIALSKYSVISVGANIENLDASATGSTAIHILGNTLNNTITGNSAANQIEGNDGDDSINGGGGNDTIFGGVGEDTLIGGSGNDFFYVNLKKEGSGSTATASIEDVIAESANAGSDSVVLIGKPNVAASAIDMRTMENVENIYLLFTGKSKLNVIGNALDNFIVGNQAANILDGGAGESDSVSYQYATGGVSANLATGVVSGADGADTLIGIENLYGSNFKDTLIGNDQDNFLRGNGGADTLAGGAGNDFYDVNIKLSGKGASAQAVFEDVVTENADEGTEDNIRLAGTVKLQTATTFDLSTGALANIENFDIFNTGVTKLNVIGNEAKNTLNGNEADNRLEGKGGDDFLDGGINPSTGVIPTSNGKDTLDGGDGNDTLRGGTDSDSLDGGDGNDSLDGGAGADTMKGGAGDDIYVATISKTGQDSTTSAVIEDSITENSDEGIDTLKLSGSVASIVNALTISLADAYAHIENLDVSGTSSTKLNLQGNDSNNILTGNTAANSISGGLGDDTITAGSGDDTLNGGDGIDSLTGGSGNDTYQTSIVISGSGDSATAALEDKITEGSSVSDTADSLVISGELSLTNAATITLATGDLANIENVDISATGSTKLKLEGNSSNNLLIGNAAANDIKGNAGNDTIEGGDGVDSLFGGAGNDVFIVKLNASGAIEDSLSEAEGAGSDTIRIKGEVSLASVATISLADLALSNFEHIDASLSGATKLNLTGNASSNNLTGNDADNQLEGAAGNDSLLGGGGQDTLNGGADNDTLNGGAGNDSLIGGAGDDLYITSLGFDSVTGLFIEDAFLELADGGIDSIRLNGTFTSASTTTISLAEGAFANFENLDISNTGATSIHITGNSANNALIGNDAANQISGEAGDDSIHGGAGNDTLNGGIGNDTLNGGTGIDSLVGGAGDDTYTADIKVSGSGKNATIVLEDSVTELLNEGSDTLKLQGTLTLANTVTLALGTNLANIENLDVSSTGITKINLTGNQLDNSLIGNNAANLIIGGAGNDSLTGGLGVDTLEGGDGDDVYTINLRLKGTGQAAQAALEDVLNEQASQGNDTLRLSSTVTLTNATNISLTGKLANIENIDASLSGDTKLNLSGNSGDNILTGNSASNLLNGAIGDDTLNGGAGDDTLDGGAGTDSLSGGTGNDTYLLSLSALTDSTVGFEDTVVEQESSGSDTLRFSNEVSLTNAATIALAAVLANFENIDISQTGSSKLNLEGNASNNSLIGNAANNILTGLNGADSLNGGLGVDTLIGGAGDDLYTVALTLSDTTVSLEDTITEVADEGTDTLKLTGEFSATGVSTLTLTLATGTYKHLEHIDASSTGTTKINLVGNDANNRLTGNSADNDINAGAGADTLIGGLGNDTLNGEAGADSLDGGDGNDSMLGGDDNDTMTGGAGADMMDAGVGNDSLNGGDGNDSIAGGDGNDTLSGAAGNDTITGGAGNDSLDGGAGDDSMTGGAGDDTYTIDSANDVIVEAAEGGTDTVITNQNNYQLLANFENLILSGTAITATGNELNNVITGNSQKNVLNGGAGNDSISGGTGADTMAGGTGDDVYTVDDAGDVLTEVANEGTDTVNSSITFVLADNFENLTLTGSSAINGTGNGVANNIAGNSGANTITGNAGNDSLSGGAGNDTILGGADNDILTGGTGIDSLTGGAGADIFVFESATSDSNHDIITDFVHLEDTLRFNKSVFTALPADEGDAGYFVSGSGLTAAADAATRLIYDTDTGNLYYDADGNGTGSQAVLIATLDGKPVLTTDDFGFV